MSRQRSLEVLGIEPESSPQELNSAFRKGVKTHHPDKGGDPAALRELLDAFHELLEVNAQRAGVEVYRRRRGIAAILQQWRRRQARTAAVAGLNESERRRRW